MPEGWLEDAEEIIPDPSATKPDDWDDEADGEWEPVMVSESAGCWTYFSLQLSFRPSRKKYICRE